MIVIIPILPLLVSRLHKLCTAEVSTDDDFGIVCFGLQVVGKPEVFLKYY